MTDLHSTQIKALRKAAAARQRIIEVQLAQATANLHAAIRAASNAGMTYRSIAAESGLSFQRVAQVAKEGRS
jgi:hypothetical protein